MVLNGWSRPLAVLAAVGLVVTACSGSATPVPSTAAPATVAPSRRLRPPRSPREASPSAAASGIPRGGTLSIAYQSDLQHLDPAVMYDTVGIAAVRLMFEAPLTYDTGTKLQPMLASEMPTVSADGKT